MDKLSFLNIVLLEGDGGLCCNNCVLVVLYDCVRVFKDDQLYENQECKLG